MDQSCPDKAEKKEIPSLEQCYSQRGLCYVSTCAVFATFHIKGKYRDRSTYDLLKNLAGHLNEKVQKMEVETKRLSTSDASDRRRPQRRSATGLTHAVILGVGLDLWQKFGKHLPEESSRKSIINDIDRILSTSPPYKNSGGDLYFHIKSDSIKSCIEILDHIKEELKDITETIIFTEGNYLRDGRVYGRRLLHGLIQVVDPINLSARVLIGGEDPQHIGGCLGLTQKFIHNWAQIEEMSQAEIEDMIGRDTNGNIIPNLDKRSHIRCVRVRDEDGLNYSIFTQGQPFGNVPSCHSREEGVYVSAYAKSIKAFNAVLDGMLGKDYKETHGSLDKHFRYSSSIEGNIWYIPSLLELGMEPCQDLQPVEINPFFLERSKNGFMYYNSKDFLHNIWEYRKRDEFPISNRTIELLENTFARWQNTWYEPPIFPSLPNLHDYLRDFTCYSKEEKDGIINSSIAERKGHAIKFTLDLFSNSNYCKKNKFDLFRIDPKELIVGILPPFTLGTGVAAMRYLSEAERINGFFLGLDETSMAGHVVPGYEIILKKGICVLMDDARASQKRAQEAGETEKIQFYQSVLYALEGVQKYFKNYAELADKILETLPASQLVDRKNLKQISLRMSRLSSKPPESFLDALQMIFSMHCCMHLIGEMVSIGRLDQLLNPFYERDLTGKAHAQEAMDCFWIKMDEKVLLNRHYYEEKRTYGTCALPYTGGPVPIGDKLSQWVMQVTVGGYENSSEKDPKDACNEVTRMALRSARRLPLNSPCLSLRLNKKTQDDIINESAKAILSGGASPFFYNDDLLVDGIMQSGPQSDLFSNSSMRLQDARNYCADGCWETVLPGQNEMALSYVLVTNVVEMALNQGSTYINAGPGNIRGSNASFLSPSSGEIKNFDEFLDIFYEHFKWQMANFFNGIYSRYGNIWKFCPSPLLSSLVEGCMQSGRDLSNGGARYHLLMPMIFGVPCAIDSLWAIKKMVFDDATAVTSLPELLECLFCDWGYDMIEPFQSSQGDPERSELKARRFKDLREIALKLPKFGSGHKEVDEFGGQIAGRLKDITYEIFNNPEKAVSMEMRVLLDGIIKKYSIAAQNDRNGRPFVFHLVPAYGTFEDYIGLGLQNGASADGRRKGSSLSSNFSPMSSPMDLPPDLRPRDIFGVLEGWNGPAFEKVMKIVAPVDIDISENLPLTVLIDVLHSFRQGKLGSNMLSISCADRETLANAQKYPERYDLLRLRYGGWSEFFIGMYRDHQEQHMRRPIFADLSESS
jgi:Dyp-type peroxidase family